MTSHQKRLLGRQRSKRLREAELLCMKYWPLPEDKIWERERQEEYWGDVWQTSGGLRSGS